MENLTNIIEAILFASGKPVSTGDIKSRLSVGRGEFNKAVRELAKKYSGSCGIMLLQFNGKLQLSTNPDYKNEVAAVVAPIREKEFTRTVLECAAIIAYRQPITKAELEQIRGVSCDYAIRSLLEIEMIRTRGRKDVPGRPILYGTTDEFLKRFHLKNLSELPDYDTLMQRIAAATEQAEAEPLAENSYIYASSEERPEEEELPSSGSFSASAAAETATHADEKGVSSDGTGDSGALDGSSDSDSDGAGGSSDSSSEDGGEDDVPDFLKGTSGIIRIE